MKRVSIIGTVGVPANYGGFESLVENIIGYNSPSDIHYTVYCSAKSYPHRQSVYKNADLRYVPLDANGSQSILYDIVYRKKATTGNAQYQNHIALLRCLYQRYYIIQNALASIGI